MPIVYQDWITRRHLRSNPEDTFVFGDNVAASGLGGQAKEMRGERNAFGIPTKMRPGREEDDYFTDSSPSCAIHMVRSIGALFHMMLTKPERKIVVPSKGLGTGLSELPTRAPRLYRILYDSFAAASECPWEEPDYLRAEEKV